MSTKRKFKCPCGETTVLLEPRPNHFVDCIVHASTLHPLYERLESIAKKIHHEFQHDANGGSECTYCELANALSELQKAKGEKTVEIVE